MVPGCVVGVDRDRVARAAHEPDDPGGALLRRRTGRAWLLLALSLAGAFLLLLTTRAPIAGAGIGLEMRYLTETVCALVLALGDYRSGTTGDVAQPDSAVTAITLGFSVLPAALTLLSLAWLGRYRLDADAVEAPGRPDPAPLQETT